MAVVLQEIVTEEESGNVTSITLTLGGAPSSGELLVISVAIRMNNGAFTFPTGFTSVAKVTGARGEHEMAFKVAGGSEGTTFEVTYSGTARPQCAGMWVFSGMDANPFDVFKTAGPSGVNVITAGPTDAIAQADSLAVMDCGHYASGAGWDASPAPSFGGTASNNGAVDDATTNIDSQTAGAYSHAVITGTGTVSGTTLTHSSGSLSQRMTGIVAVFKAAAVGGNVGIRNPFGGPMVLRNPLGGC